MSQITRRIIITGIVQGVGFRPFLFNLLRKYQLKGQIKNTGNLGVTLTLQADRKNFDFEYLTKVIIKKAPEMAFIEDIRLIPISDLNDDFPKFSELEIVPSNNGIGKGLTLPPDIAMCPKCLDDFNNPKLARFYHYPFIACAQCGPRFTIMKSLPYDRPRSTVDSFPFCKECIEDYEDFDNRRFHAQTFNCKECGPHYFLSNNVSNIPENSINSKPINNRNESEIDQVAEAIKAGKIIALKGIGGVNLICRADSKDAISKLRDRKRKRKYKPFAIMMPNIQTAKKYVKINHALESELLSFRHPIILFPKILNTLPENVALGLPNVGILLPYMGIHYLLFQKLGPIPLIFTSGNFSSLPMGIHNREIIRQLQDLADIFYLHNREIFQRCDDSVIRPVMDIPALIRRSRGYVPEYIRLPFNSPFSAMIAVGAELNSTGAVARGNRIFPTQHIGNVRNLETYFFLKSSILHMKELLKIADEEIECIARDQHPAFQSTRLASELANEFKSRTSKQTFSIQPIYHHHAHLASLLVDHQLPLEEEIIAITIDGIGYGKDHQPWGGEVLKGSYNSFERVGHLKPIPMIGGDLCAKNPARMLLCCLLNSRGYHEHPKLLNNFIQSHDFALNFPQKELELKVIISQFLKSPEKHPQTSSFGRILDAIASLFDVCNKRTYRGEPAMRLEGFIWNSPSVQIFERKRYVHDFVIDTDQLLWDYMKLLSLPEYATDKVVQARLARSLVKEITLLFADIAIEKALEFGISKIGVSGGVAYNEIIMQTLKREIESKGLTFLQHSRVPPGDAGISIGQIAIAAARATNKR